MVTDDFTALDQGDLTDPNCPSRLVLDRIGDKWTVLVVLLLRDGPLRFGELRERIGGVAAKVLTSTLRRMERDGMLTRTSYPEIPPRVEYRLTDLGRSLCEPINAVAEWAEANIGRIQRARAEHDAAGSPA